MLQLSLEDKTRFATHVYYEQRCYRHKGIPVCKVCGSNCVCMDQYINEVPDARIFRAFEKYQEKKRSNRIEAVLFTIFFASSLYFLSWITSIAD
jgi:hypothetical protein